MKQERDEAFTTVNKLREKCELMNDVMKVAVQEQSEHQIEMETAIDRI